MVSRRTFLSLAVASMSAPRVAFAQPETRKVALYANVGADLTHYDVDVAGAALIKRATVTLPAGVQYAWPHVSRRYLYVATSSSASGYGPAGTEHHVTAVRIDPASGALKVFDYKKGVLTNEVCIAPEGGRNFGPRHLDFHPTKPWMYVSIETQNKMYTYKLENGRINPETAFRGEPLAEPTNRRSRQAAGTVHVHPNGRFLYGANRAQDTVDFQGKKVFKGGENSIVVYSIDQTTGEPTPIQQIETRAIHPRTFHLDTSGHMLVAQHNLPVDVRDGDAVRTSPAGLSVFRIGDDGKLTFVRKYDVDVGGKTMFWMGMVQL